MKKKLMPFLAGLALLASLSACSTSSKSSTASSSETKTSESTTSSSSSASKTLKDSTVTYLTDADIEAMETLGDYKASFKALIDAYVKDFEDLIAQLPEESQEALHPYRDQLVESLNSQYETLVSQFATYGDDATPLPAETKPTLTASLRNMRDQLQSVMQTAREQARVALEQ